jgi:hypothetical protein
MPRLIGLMSELKNSKQLDGTTLAPTCPVAYAFEISQPDSPGRGAADKLISSVDDMTIASQSVQRPTFLPRTYILAFHLHDHVAIRTSRSVWGKIVWSGQGITRARSSIFFERRSVYCRGTPWHMSDSRLTAAVRLPKCRRAAAE